MPSKLISRPAGRVDRALRRRRGVPGGHQLDPAPVEARRCRRGCSRERRQPSSPISPATSMIATTVAPVRLAIATVSPKWSAWPWVSRIVVASTSSAVDRGLRVAGQERVDQHRRVAVGEREAGVAEKTDIHRASVLLFGFQGSGDASARASSKPTATPTSMPSRVSSASSVRSDRSRAPRRSSRRRLADRLFVGGVEPAALGDRRGEHALQLRRGAHHQLLRLAKPRRVADRAIAASSSASV